MTEPLRFEVCYARYTCASPCIPTGCPGHATNDFVSFVVDDVRFIPAGVMHGVPVLGPTDEMRRIGRAIERLQNAVALASVTGGEFCAEARAAGRGPCGACSWCVKQAQERAERAEAEVERLRKVYTTHLTVED
jgi:hypothetical protein